MALDCFKVAEETLTTNVRKQEWSERSLCTSSVQPKRLVAKWAGRVPKRAGYRFEARVRRHDKMVDQRTNRAQATPDLDQFRRETFSDRRRCYLCVDVMPHSGVFCVQSTSVRTLNLSDLSSEQP